MPIRLKPGVKVRPQPPSALSKYIGYISEDRSSIPNHEKVYFPDLNVVLTFGHDELDMWVQEGSAWSACFTNDAELTYASPKEASPWSPGDPNWEQADPGDENDYAGIGHNSLWAFSDDGLTGDDEAPGPYDSRKLYEDDDFVQELNEFDNGFHAEVFVNDEVLTEFVQFDISYISDGKEGKHVGVLMTPDAAYALAEKLLDAAEKAEAHA